MLTTKLSRWLKAARDARDNIQTINANVQQLPQFITSTSEGQLDRYFRYQNSLIIALGTFAESTTKIFSFNAKGRQVHFYLPYGASDIIQREIIRTSYFYQPKPLNFIHHNQLLPNAPVVADVGANIGNHTLFAALLMNASHCYAFEPNPPAFAILQRNIEINSLQHSVSLFNIALGARTHQASNSPIHYANLGGNAIKEDPRGSVTVKRLDDLDIPPLDFIKIDAEGNGGQVLQGALSAIERDKPLLLVESSSQAESESIEHLKNTFGYKEIARFKHDLLLTAKPFPAAKSH
jgi:FkbM family methyltransferase